MRSGLPLPCARLAPAPPATAPPATRLPSPPQLKRDWRDEHERNKARDLQLAQENKARIEQVRRNARANREKQTNRRMMAARLERENDIVAVQAKKTNLRKAQLVRGKVYSHRYVTQKEAEEMEQSSFRRLFGIPSASNSPVRKNK